jgi:hypothetical protein
MGCPIGIPADRRLFAPPRSFSQLVTSFFASESPGIHHAPLLISSYVCSIFPTLYLYKIAIIFSRFSFYIFFQHVKELYPASRGIACIPAIVKNIGVEPMTFPMKDRDALPLS